VFLADAEIQIAIYSRPAYRHLTCKAASDNSRTSSSNGKDSLSSLLDPLSRCTGNINMDETTKVITVLNISVEAIHFNRSLFCWDRFERHTWYLWTFEYSKAYMLSPLNASSRRLKGNHVCELCFDSITSLRSLTVFDLSSDGAGWREGKKWKIRRWQGCNGTFRIEETRVDLHFSGTL